MSCIRTARHAFTLLVVVVVFIVTGLQVRAETTNLRITTQWLDETTLRVVRQNETGDAETILVNAKTGEVETLSSDEPSSVTGQFRGGRAPRSGPSDDSLQLSLVNQSGQSVSLYWIDSNGGKRRYETIAPGKTYSQHTYVGHVWEAYGDDGTYYGNLVATRSEKPVVIKESFPLPKRSRRRVRPETGTKIQLGNPIRIREGDTWRDLEVQGIDRKETERLTMPSLSPDGKVAIAWLRTTAKVEPVHTIRSSPRNGGRAELNSRPYRLPGDPMDEYKLVAFNAQTGDRLTTESPTIDFGRPRVRWRGDHELIYEKIDRGHQRFRVFVIDALAGEVRTPIDETTETFLWTIHGPSCPLTSYLPGNDQVIYASEQSGYRHLTLVDLTGKGESRPLTQANDDLGEFLVREIVHIDPEGGFIDLVVGCLYDGQDPYHRHLMRVALGSDQDAPQMTVLTDGDGDHEYAFSPDRRYVVVNHSRVDRPPVHELRDCKDGRLIATLATAVRTSNEPLPIRFTAKGRDGKTDIWGFLCLPESADANGPASSEEASLPIIEAIYAGPHDSHVPKQYRDTTMFREWTDLGLAVVKIDGMGTANRSKAFHDVCWQNLKDAGFPDRIAWIKAAARQFPILDVNRVGIYGTSAGGQNACGALLFHGDFYKAAMASCGCHDNRMDKSSWNEQWMGYPVGKHYGESSNIDNASRLQGDLLLLVGELDSNVPPESTLRLVDALIKADKRFEFLMIPGMGHSDGGTYGRNLTRDFFVRKLNPGTGKTPVRDTVLVATKQDAPAEDAKPENNQAEKVDTKTTTKWQRARQLYEVDLARLHRRFPVRIAADSLVQLDRFLDAWHSALPTQGVPSDDAAALNELRSAIVKERRLWRQDQQQRHALLTAHLFAGDLIELVDLGERGNTLNHKAVAEKVEQLLQVIPTSTGDGSKTIAHPRVYELVGACQSWRRFYADYDPSFDWWLGETSETLCKRVEQWARTIPESIPFEPSGGTPAPLATSHVAPFLAANYPPLDELATGNGMPELMRLYDRDVKRSRSVTNEMLDQWNERLDSLRINGKSFEEWSRDDQVDFHRLKQIIQLRKKSLEPIPDSTPVRGKDMSGKRVGRDRLVAMLQSELIDHTPEELIELAEREYADCRREMISNARQLGFGDDWRAAVEFVKSKHVAPGDQPGLVRGLAESSVKWIRERDLMTIDPMAEATWRMQMMTPDRQRVNPFFTGGEVISVSFPTRQMTLEEKRQGLRGNNPAFSKATVHHELIPGHHLQMYQMARFQPQRQRFSTPFWLEGWAVYWEFVMYEGGFPTTPEERLGFLVWRAHRYSRILFSLRFHMGQLTPDQCVDFLVDNVCFDRKNAEAEVRRSIGPSYPPLYQAAYMLGAMQLRTLAARWEKEQRGSRKEFHDKIITNGPLPMALLQAILFDQPLEKETPPMWSFD
ncbi:MAG: DUF885 family protein [Planctomycetota bacterium]